MTQWHFHAFDADLLSKYALEPIRRSVGENDPGLWRTTLSALEKVFPACDLGEYALYPNDKPVTALSWWKGRPDLEPNRPPSHGSESLRALCWSLVWAVSPLRLKSSELRPGPRFTESIDKKASPQELEEYSALEAEIFSCRRDIKAPFDFLRSRDVSSSFVPAPVVVGLATVVEAGGYLKRVSEERKATNPALASDFEALRHFLPLAASRGLSLHYYEPGT